jgi:hypothetical protein
MGREFLDEDRGNSLRQNQGEGPKRLQVRFTKDRRGFVVEWGKEVMATITALELAQADNPSHLVDETVRLVQGRIRVRNFTNALRQTERERKTC